jgi:hypothetical protein
MKLSVEHIDIIRNRINESKISIQTLKDDVVDHLCCVVEYKIGKGKSFEIALAEAIRELAPKGLDDLQQQTVFLLQPSKIIFMKKLMYTIGLMSTVAMSLGWLSTTLRWLGGYQLFNYGFLAFFLLFVPMLAIDRYKVNVQKALSEKLRIIIGACSGIIVGISLVFKFLHLQGADILLVMGVLLFTFGFLPFLFFNLYKKAVSSEPSPENIKSS